jgi:hypothetical protein
MIFWIWERSGDVTDHRAGSIKCTVEIRSDDVEATTFMFQASPALGATCLERKSSNTEMFMISRISDTS